MNSWIHVWWFTCLFSWAWNFLLCLLTLPYLWTPQSSGFMYSPSRAGMSFSESLLRIRKLSTVSGIREGRLASINAYRKHSLPPLAYRNQTVTTAPRSWPWDSHATQRKTEVQCPTLIFYSYLGPQRCLSCFKAWLCISALLLYCIQPSHEFGIEEIH